MLTGSRGESRPEAPAELIERAKHDRAAFGELYDLYLRRVYAFCLARSKDQQEAEDLTAQTFERALVAIERYEHRGAPLSSWLFRIAANLVTDQARRRGGLVLMGDNSLPEPVDTADLNPEEQVVRWERAAWLRSHLSALPPDQQRALRLRFWEGNSVAEVAARLNRNENATKQLLHRAMQNVRRSIGREMNPDV